MAIQQILSSNQWYLVPECNNLSQKAMAELFGVQTPAISKHLKNIFFEGELDDKVVVAKIATTTQHGAIEGKTQTRDAQFYNPETIISVGYRVNSHRASYPNLRDDI